MMNVSAESLTELRRTNAELAASRRAALNALEDAVLARDALRDREAWLRGQRAALEAALNAAPLTASLGRLVRTATAALGDGTRAAFFLADHSTGLRHVVGMPAAYAELVDGFKVGPESLACGLAAHSQEPVITADVMTDPRWEDWQWLAARFDFRGCWSFPIHTAAGTLVGTLAFYWPHPRQATARELELADLLTHTAGIIISRHQEAEARRQAEEALAAEKEYAESIVETLHEPLLVLHPDLTVKGVNPAFYTHFRVNPADTVGRKVYELGNGQWDIPALRTLLEDVLPDSNVFNDYEVTHQFETLGRRVMLVNGRRLDHVQLILLGIRDITERAAAAEALRASEERQAFLLRLSDAVRHLVDPDEVKAAAARVLGEHLQVNRAFYAEVEGDDWVVARGYEHGGPPLPDGRYSADTYGHWVMRTYREGGRIVFRDTQSDPRFAPAERAAHASAGIIGAVGVPLVKDGRLVAILAVHTAAPRDWTDAEIALVEETAERTWASVQRARAEAALRASEEKYRTLFESIDEGFLINEMVRDEAGRATDLRMLEANPAYTRQTGLGREMVGKLGSEILPNMEPFWLDTYDRVARTGNPERVEHYNQDTDRWYAAHVSRVGGDDRRVAVVFDDVTARKRAEDDLRRSEERVRLALAIGGLGTWDWDVRTGAVVWNDDHFRMHGYAVGEVPASYEAWLERVHPNDRTGAEAALAEARDTRRPYAQDFRSLHPDGTVRWLFARGSFFYDEGGAAVRMVGVVRDVTEPRRAEADLRESEEKYRALVESQVEMVCRFRPDGTILMVNTAYARVYGKTAAELIGTSFWNLIPPEEHAGVRARLDALTPESPQIQIENLVTSARGPRWTMWTNRGLRFDEAGRVTEAQSVGMDITERKLAEAAVKASEERLRAVAANLPQGAVFVVDHDLRYSLAAGEALGPAGYSSAEVEGKTVAEVLPPHLAERRAANFRRALAGEPFRTEDAAHGRHYVTHGVPLRDAAGRVTAALAVSYDITDRKLAEEGVRKAEERLRLALTAARMGIWTLDADTGAQVRDANLNALLGLEPVETTQPFAEFFAHIHPGDRAAVEAAFARSIQDHQPLNVEFRVVRPDGTVRWLRDQGDVYHTAGGRLLAGACVDITELKEAEAALQAGKDRLEERVAERTAELATAVDALEAEMGRRRELAGRLTTAQEDERRRIARDLHDSLGQYLAAMSLELTAAHTLAAQPEVRDRLRRLTELAAETGREVHRLALELRPTALDDLGLVSALQNYVEAWSTRTGLPVEFGERGMDGQQFPWQVSTAVYRVVQEALTNVARHARATRVSVLVERQPDHLSVVVEDDGVGFDPDRVLDRPSTRGGLGLLGMRERMALVDGTIEIESATGSGTAVFVRIPLPAHEGGSHDG